MDPSKPFTASRKMESNLDIVAVNDLIKLAQKSTEEAKDNPLLSSPIMTRARSIMKNVIPENFNKVKSTAITMLQGKKSLDIDETDPKKVDITINWIVSLLKDLLDKVNGQTELLASLMNKIVDLVEPKENLEEEFRKKHEKLEADFQLKSDAFEKVVREKQDDLEKEFNIKHEEVEMKCDEARQRGLKGNLIVSSPERKDRNGQFVNTLAVRDNNRDSVRKESVTEMVVRLVKIKTGQEIPLQDIVACHPIGKNKDSHTYILSVANRKPGSAWDIITTGMRKGFNNQDNIFLNFQLTHRRIALSKEVKQARKDSLIKKYSIDANGKIWIKQLNKDTFKEVTTIDNLQKLINNIDS